MGCAMKLSLHAFLLLLCASVFGAGCTAESDVDNRGAPVGDRCERDDACSSGVCHEGVCVRGVESDMNASDIADVSVDPMTDMGSGQEDMSTPLEDMTTARPVDPVDCSSLDGEDWSLCESTSLTCGVVYEDGAGCAAVCDSAGLVCAQVFENQEGVCAADRSRPALSCDPPSGHQSDYCVCVRPGCEACAFMSGATCYEDGTCACTPKTCASAGYECGQGLDDGCGGTLDCPGTCPQGEVCQGGTCGLPVTQCLPGDCPAFPGAEGFGREAIGGRGGDVCHVTNTNDSGSGSLRACANSGSGPLTIVFDVGGIISLDSPLRIRRDRLTIAGESAPGDGITIRNYQVDIRGDDIILRHVRFRAGDLEKKTSSRDGFTEDSLTVSGENVIIDHVSASWGIDENLSAGSAFDNMTLQYSIISEGLYHTKLFHGEYTPDRDGHSMGGLYKPKEGDSKISIHHNLWAHNNNRNPAIGTYNSGQEQSADIRNNVIYNCQSMGYSSGDGGKIDVNYISNYAIFGPDSDSSEMFRGNNNQDVNIYQSDNLIDRNRNGTFDGVDRGWSSIGGDYDQQNSTFSMAAVTTQAAAAALPIVLENAGARPWSRDEVDQRIVQEVKTDDGERIDSQSEVGGWGVVNPGAAVVDTDRDGIPDAWESANGTNPNSADNNGDVNGDGYTNLENYLHWASRTRP